MYLVIRITYINLDVVGTNFKSSGWEGNSEKAIFEIFFDIHNLKGSFD